MAYEFRFPDIGEGVTEGEILSWKVKEGDVVTENQTLAEMETDKAVIELPSPRAGRVLSLHGAEGDVVQVGDVVITIEEGSEAAAPPAAAPPGAAPSGVEAAGGPAPRARTVEEPTEAEEYAGTVVGRLEEAVEETPGGPAREAPAPEPVSAPREVGPDMTVLAMPAVRVLAGELGVDLATLRGTGSGGRILKQDVEDVARAGAFAAAPPRGAESTGPTAPVGAPQPQAGPREVITHVEEPCPAGPPLSPLLGGTLDRDAFGPIERVAFRGVRRTMAKRMAEAMANQAHVTAMDEADVTIIKHIREKERSLAAERGVRLTYLAFIVKACTASLMRFPRLNAVLDESRREFSLKRYYNIGVAVDTKAGLVVPNIKDADKKGIFAIAEEIVDLVERAEQRRLELRELHGGTFTITNYGSIGSIFATPVINYPEVAILGVGRVREVPMMREKQVISRLLVPLSLTFDHQLIDGAEATRFLNLVIGYLQDPDLLLLEGA